MKVLYSCISKSWGGLEMRTIQGAEQLINKNIEVDLLCYPGSQINFEAEKRGINCIKLKASGYFNPFQIYHLKKILKRNFCNLIHTQLSKDIWVLVPALKYLGSNIPLVLTKRMESSVIKKDFMHKWLYNRVNLILAISNVIKKNVIETCPVPEEKVLLHYNGVNLKKFDPSFSDREKIRNEFKINENEIVIGMLSRITPGKGYEEILQAAKKLIKENSNLKFLLVGDASPDEIKYEREIKRLVQVLGLQHKAVFTGFREDTVDLLSAMDIFVFPSHAESFGNSLIEAMAMEKPCVAADSHGILDIVIDGKTGILFKNKDANDLADKIKRFIHSPDKRTEYGKAAREYVKNNFDVEKQTEKLIEIYKTLI